MTIDIFFWKYIESKTQTSLRNIMSFGVFRAIPPVLRNAFTEDIKTTRTKSPLIYNDHKIQIIIN